MHTQSLLVGFVLGSLFWGLLGAFYLLIAPWLKSFFSGARVSLPTIIGMRFRGSPPGLLIETLVMFVQGGRRDIGIGMVESVYLANKHFASSPKALYDLVTAKYPADGA